MRQTRWTSVLLFVLCMIIVVSVSDAAPQITYIDLKEYGAAIIPPSTAEFHKILNQYVNSASLATLNPMMPYTVIVKNDSGAAWISVSLVYELKNKAGLPMPQRFTVQTLNGSRNRMILPGEHVFFTPLTKLNRKLQTGPVQMALAGGQQLGWADEQVFAGQSDIRVSLDSIVSEDGTITGPDTINNLAAINAFVSADWDLADSLLTKTGDGLRQYLSAIINSPDVSLPSNPYEWRRRHTANMYYSMLQAGGEDALRRSIKQ